MRRAEIKQSNKKKGVRRILSDNLFALKLLYKCSRLYGFFYFWQFGQ